MLMGVHLYTPTSGRFLSTDPVYGGGDNSYGYPGDPVNQFDLDGRFWGSMKKWWREQRRSHASPDMLHSSVRFGLGVASFQYGGPVIKGASRLRWRHVRHPIRTAKYIRRACNTWGPCALTGFAISRSSRTYWHGRNTYRHANRYIGNFYGRLLNSMSPTSRYRPRKWKGYF